MYRTRLVESALQHVATLLMVVGLLCALGVGAKYFSVFG
jgi:hypothetical protein